MKKSIFKFTAVSLIAALIAVFAYMPAAAEQFNLNGTIADTAEYLLEALPSPARNAANVDIAMIGLARSGETVPDSYFENYYTELCSTLSAQNGILPGDKSPDYSRTILTLTALGYNPVNIAGYNLLMNLSDFNKGSMHGTGGSIMALIALDSANYDIPDNPSASRQSRRELYLADVMSMQLPDGGFSTDGMTSDTITTAAALQALSKYTQKDDVKVIISHAISYLSSAQLSTGGFADNDPQTCAQVIIALCELGIKIDDKRLVKNGNTLLTHLAEYYTPGQGFSLVIGGANDIELTGYALCAMTALKRINQGKTSLYNMTDVKARDSIPAWTPPTSTPDNNTSIDDAPVIVPPIIDTTPKTGLPNKDKNIAYMPILTSGKTFDDIADNSSKTAILDLASRGIVNGKNDSAFDPNATMTRAEFAAIIVRSLGMEPMTTKIVSLDQIFDDVAVDAWCSGYINVAYHYNIINGTSETVFSPNSTITREEAAVMIERTANLCGMYTYMPEEEVLDITAHFDDASDISGWAMPSIALCFKHDILPQSELHLMPKAEMRRFEIAEMVFRMLKACELI